MSTILLPAIRWQRHNLYAYTAAGIITTSTVTPNFGGGHRVKLTDVGLKVGDVVSASAEVHNAVSGENSRVNLRFEDASNVALQTNSATFSNNTSFTRQFVLNATIPANTDEIYLYADRQSGAGSISIRNGMIHRGANAATFEHAKRGAAAQLAHVAFGMLSEQVPLSTTAGVTQITSFPSRLWRLRFSTIEYETSSGEFREWDLALNQLSDITNVFRFVPPDYHGPSTGYQSWLPNVNGGGQLGTSLVCDGVSASSPILGAGDYASFEVTSPKGNTNVQLFKMAAPATSDGSGNVTLTFTKPIRQAPADNAAVQIYSPTAQFRLTQPQHETASDDEDFAAFSVDAIEQVFP